GMRTRFGHGLAGRAAALGRVVCGRGDRGGPRRYPGRSYVILPLGTGQRCEGVVNLTGLPGDILPSDEVLTGWRRIAEVAGRARGAAQRSSRAAADAGADAVTGLPNRRTFDRVLDRELERAARSTGALTLVLFDVDHFRRVNNTYGHASGDRVLSEVARRLCAAFRQTDLVTRWGGEEFAAILPQTGSPGSEDPTAPAERARRLVGDRPVLLDGGQRCSVTISGGVAVCPHDARDAAGLVAHADRGLYEAKGGGRNRIVRAPPGDDVDGAAGGRAGPQA
ncbi:MAG: GGDEF domain-containing protein, partial [Planctomycetota bacterium]